MARLALILAALLVSGGTQAQGLVTDISRELVELRYNFAGADLLLFGAITDDGDPNKTVDVVVTVQGPPESIVVRKKERVVGVWANAAAVTFVDAPGYYALASTRPLEEIASARTRAAQQVGPESLQLTAAGPVDEATYRTFRAALLDKMAEAGLLQWGEGTVSLRENALFRTDVRLPANVPVGVFTAEVFLFVDGELKARRSTAIRVDKTGFERAVYTFAQAQPLAYGLVAVAIALLAGWAASFISRR